MADKKIVKVYMASSMNVLSLNRYYANITPGVERNNSAGDHKNVINKEVSENNRIGGSDESDKKELSAKVQGFTD